MKHYWKWR
jgi:hypothetical protein